SNTQTTPELVGFSMQEVASYVRQPTSAHASVQRLGSLVEGLQALTLKDKAWVRTALGLLRRAVSRDCAGGRVAPPDGAGIGANDQRRQLL
ncbi:unnamed protein product, partial [Ectocarpus sp. 12 AP-2014]